MSPFDVLKTAITSMGANKLRAGLTLLGIVIGVTAVISLMAIGKGAQESITSRIESLGTNLLFVRPGATNTGGIFGGQGSASTLTLEDAYAMLDPEFTPSVAAAAPELSTRVQIVAGRENTSTQAIGVTPEYEFVRNYSVDSGSFVTSGQVMNRSEVVVLGSSVAETLFGFRDPVGQTVRINSRRFEVIGVLASQGGGAFGLFDDQALVPVTTAYYRLSAQRTAQGGISVGSINVQVQDGYDMETAVDEIATLLRLRHRTTEEDDFTVSSQEETIETLEETTDVFIMFLGGIAGISLLVGGIGIMNIMLVSVTERTREIGIRKAMGAKRRDILFQFVSEASLLSLGGGIAGVIAGYALARALDGRELAGQSFETAFSSEIAALALVVSVVIGLFFGIYPAMRAARLHPIDALRYE
ncbi:MAG: ABC transporter permease [SAR202 cluster bacterium]|nr:ABC transporter permease [SAR202 cluster bacterium]MDP6300669.1 ABC transporter permease [SAR202 cluster bacterium]MDP7225883.1 ABC transporter permease [SAR202 cluster bacterium]MDP7534569.1 ABC transporter permease [SAR202 cluster bacterium]HJO83383.1 ABC transporter permease [SAR202 cluster bacterium]